MKKKKIILILMIIILFIPLLFILLIIIGAVYPLLGEKVLLPTLVSIVCKLYYKSDLSDIEKQKIIQDIRKQLEIGDDYKMKFYFKSISMKDLKNSRFIRVYPHGYRYPEFPYVYCVHNGNISNFSGYGECESVKKYLSILKTENLVLSDRNMLLKYLQTYFGEIYRVPRGLFSPRYKIINSYKEINIGADKREYGLNPIAEWVVIAGKTNIVKKKTVDIDEVRTRNKDIVTPFTIEHLEAKVKIKFFTWYSNAGILDKWTILLDKDLKVIEVNRENIEAHTEALATPIY